MLTRSSVNWLIPKMADITFSRIKIAEKRAKEDKQVVSHLHDGFCLSCIYYVGIDKLLLTANKLEFFPLAPLDTKTGTHLERVSTASHHVNAKCDEQNTIPVLCDSLLFVFNVFFYLLCFNFN